MDGADGLLLRVESAVAAAADVQTTWDYYQLMLLLLFFVLIASRLDISIYFFSLFSQSHSTKVFCIYIEKISLTIMINHFFLMFRVLVASLRHLFPIMTVLFSLDGAYG